MINTGLFTSGSSEYETPQDLFDYLHNIYHFTLDTCATEKNAKLPKFYTQEQNGLAQDWSKDRCWMNPPYGREISLWCEKAVGTPTVALLPARTDTRWWHEYALKARIILFIKGRLKFNSINSAPFPSAVAVFDILPVNPMAEKIRLIMGTLEKVNGVWRRVR